MSYFQLVRQYAMVMLESYGGTDVGILVQCRTARVSPERHNRMVELAKQYGWHANIPYKDTTE